MHTCIREYLRARLPACMCVCVCLCEYATGTGQCLITANTGCRRCFFKLACCSLYPLADLLVVVVVVVIIDVGIVVACFFFVVAPTSFSTYRCCLANGFCVWNVHFRLLLPSSSSSGAAAAAAGSDTSEPGKPRSEWANGYGFQVS